MACVSLADGYLPGRDQFIRVFVSRLWQFRGGFEAGSVKQIHLVLTDEQGNHAHGFIPYETVCMFIDQLHCRNVYEIRKYRMVPRRSFLRPVESMSLVVFNCATTVVRQNGIPSTFIQWSYNLTPLRELPLSSETPERLTDVIGMITQISDIGSFHFPQRSTPLCARDVFIQDDSGYEIQVRLWGHSAQRFNGENIRDLGQNAMAVVIFYGTTVRTYGNKHGLAGGEACGWYINEGIPEICTYMDSMSARFKPIARAPTPEGMSLRLQVGNQYPRKTITELINFNLFENEDAMFRCTVRVDRLNLSEKWWQLYCLDCQRPSIPLSGPMYTAPYQCRNPVCLSDKAGIRYRVCLICSDVTEDAEFVMMGRVAQQAIGSPIMNVLRNNQPDDLPISNLEFAARHAASPPIELAAMVSKRFRFTVVVSNGSFFRPRPSFVVRSVDAHLPLPRCQSSADLIIR